MKNLNNDLSELVNSHISIAQNFSKKSLFAEQLDFLAFWVDSQKMSLHSPFGIKNEFRDNPNWENTIYDNVYKLVDEDKIVLQYVVDGYSPVAILQRYKMNIKGVEKWKISIYGKGLRLYYCGLLDWLPDYIDTYCGEVIRADLCWDCKDKIPEGVVDLTNTVTYGEGENWSYKGFGNKRSPLFIRIYDKTLDLKKDHNSMAWLYPERYIKSCWRIECKFTGRYANSMSALQWLGVVECDGKIQKQVDSKKNYLKSAFYNLLMYVDFIPNKKLQYEILNSVKSLCNKKLKKLKDFTLLNDE